MKLTPVAVIRSTFVSTAIGTMPRSTMSFSNRLRLHQQHRADRERGERDHHLQPAARVHDAEPHLVDQDQVAVADGRQAERLEQERAA